MAKKLPPPPRPGEPGFHDWMLLFYQLVTGETTTVQTDGLTASQRIDLTDGGDSTAHYHAADRDRANHTGTQPASTITGLQALIQSLGGSHSVLGNLAWTSSGHTGTASTVGGFNGSGAAEYLTRTGTGTVVAMSAGPTFTGTTTVSALTTSDTISIAAGKWIVAGGQFTMYSDNSFGLLLQAPATSNKVVLRSASNANILEAQGGGNVGIGATPTTRLTVVYAGSSASLTAGASAAASFGASGLTDLAVTNATSDPFQITLQTRHQSVNGLSYPLAINPLGGNVGVGMVPARTLDVTGTFGATSTATFGGQLQAGDGSAAAPSYSFSSAGNTDNGMYLSASDTVAIAAAGALAASFSSSGISDAKGEVRTIVQNSQSAAYTLVLADAGKHILHPSADTTARIWTIPANSSVAFPVGTAVTFINQNGAGTITISITTDTMRLAGAGTTGSRTLLANGVATAVKVTTTEWIVSGTNLS